ncbi:MAG: SAM-dependent chlorinase/fluorinase, partial [Gammaproteobacteria bacterium]|nr:SAM-dependent chlorinase/fluorinase [Gammaproteobacteria bacterium]
MSTPFEPSGVITVTTDFGHRGPFVGTMKGVIISRFPSATIIDLTHEAHVHWPAEA